MISMREQKQQVISRFFAPKSKTSSRLPNDVSASSSSLPQPPTPPPKITATVTFSPSKRLLSSQLTSQDKPPKRPKLSPHTHNPILSSSNPSLHQKFLEKFLEPTIQDPFELPSRNSNLLSSKTVKYTPLEQQVVNIKTKYPDVLLMIEVGYKYRFFGDDAEVAAKILGIYAHMDHNFLTASIPTFRLHVHVRRLVNAGYKVGVVKQTETAAIKAHGSNRLGPFCRGLSALYTKATLEAAEDLGGGEDGLAGESNHLLCVVEKNIVVENSNSGIEGRFDVKIGFVSVEISTGDVIYGEFDDDFMRNALESVIINLSPVELLLGEPLSKQTEKLLLAYAGPASNVRMERASRDCFIDGGALAEVTTLYEKMSTSNPTDMSSEESTEQWRQQSAIEEIVKMPELAVQALAITICHLKQFGFERVLCLGSTFRPFSRNMEMTLSSNTLRQLEILNNNSDGSEAGSLLQIMNHTLTISGSRLLRYWVTHPLNDRNMISARLDAVSEIADSMGSCKPFPNFGCLDVKNADAKVIQPELSYVLSLVLNALGRAPDIQRGLTRIFHRIATPSEFIAIMQAILYAGKQLQQLDIKEKINDQEKANTFHSAYLKKLISTASSTSVVNNTVKMLSVLNKESADQGDLMNSMIISDGQFPEVGVAREDVKTATEKLDSLIGLIRKQLGIHKLEFFSVSGTTHLIELPSDVEAPPNWVKVNSTKKTNRYHPPEILEALDQLSLAKEKLAIACRDAWNNFLSGFSKYYAEFQSAVQALAALDCLHSLAILSRNKSYVRPMFVSDDEPCQIQICSGRHPVLETVLQDNFVPNDTDLHADGEYCQIVTGPNMGGKSCYIRQVALIAIMAQVGSFVPALSTKLHVLDGIFTRMGASDSIQQGRSTFLEELSETSFILQKCTANSLVIIDELGRGTSTHDGVAIAYATLQFLLEQKRSMVLFVTHYPKVADLRTEFPRSVRAYHVSYLTSDDMASKDSTSDDEDVTYLYKLVPGISGKSFGFKVAQLAQLPVHCISRARVMAARLERLVGSGIRTKWGKKQLFDALLGDQVHEDQELTSESAGCADAEEGRFQEMHSLYKEFFSEINSAVNVEDPSRSFQVLRTARSLAQEIISR